MKYLVGCLMLFGAWGWMKTLVEASAAPKERVVEVRVTEESFQHASFLCERYMKGENGVVGEVVLYNWVGDRYNLPCRVVLEEAGKLAAGKVN